MIPEVIGDTLVSNDLVSSTESPSRIIQGMGWKPDLPDPRDRHFDHLKVVRRLARKAPFKPVDLRTSGLLQPAIYQGSLGACVPHTVAKLHDYQQRRQGKPAYTASRLFLYYAARELEGSINEDAGAYIRDAMKVAATLGCPHESLWPYNVGRFTEKPPAEAYADGLDHQALSYERVAVKSVAVKAALAAGHPVAMGFSVFTSFFSIGSNGFMPVPNTDRERLEGGHATAIVGWFRGKAPWDRYWRDYTIHDNWWGEDWGDHGYFYAPMQWMCNEQNADDFWILTETE